MCHFYLQADKVLIYGQESPEVTNDGKSSKPYAVVNLRRQLHIVGEYKPVYIHVRVHAWRAECAHARFLTCTRLKGFVPRGLRL